MSWTVASDIAERIRELRDFLGGRGAPLRQEDLGKRAGVRGSQVSQWERGAQKPSRSRLERWAEREGWPVSIFMEGGPGPSDVLDGAPAPPPPSGSPPPDEAEPSELLARFYEVMADASRHGRPCPPELAVLMQSLYRLAVGGTAAEEDSGDDSRAVRANGQASVPGW